MKCPVCKDTVLIPHELDENLPSRRCDKCGGQWVAGERYYIWQERHGATPRKPPEEGLTLPVHESGPGKLCPECQRFVRRSKVGHGMNFHIDRCGTCGGIWLDANEWEILKSRNLHDEIHFIFSAAWQAEVQREEQQQKMEQLLKEKLGEGDFAEIRRIKAWLEGHPKRSELYAFLMNQ